MKEISIKVVKVPIEVLHSKIKEGLLSKGYTIKEESDKNHFIISIDVPMEIKGREGIVDTATIKGEISGKEIQITLQTNVIEETKSDTIPKKLENLSIHQKWLSWVFETTVWSEVRKIVRASNGFYSSLLNKNGSDDGTVCYQCGHIIPKGLNVCPHCGSDVKKEADPYETAYPYYLMGGQCY
jgi:hypothetical protein